MKGLDKTEKLVLAAGVLAVAIVVTVGLCEPWPEDGLSAPVEAPAASELPDTSEARETAPVGSVSASDCIAFNSKTGVATNSAGDTLFSVGAGSFPDGFATELPDCDDVT